MRKNMFFTARTKQWTNVFEISSYTKQLVFFEPQTHENRQFNTHTSDSAIANLPGAASNVERSSFNIDSQHKRAALCLHNTYWESYYSWFRKFILSCSFLRAFKSKSLQHTPRPLTSHKKLKSFFFFRQTIFNVELLHHTYPFSKQTEDR